MSKRKAITAFGIVPTSRNVAATEGRRLNKYLLTPFVTRAVDFSTPSLKTSRLTLFLARLTGIPTRRRGKDAFRL